MIDEDLTGDPEPYPGQTSIEDVLPVEGDGWRIIRGDCIERMAELDRDSIDAIVCDPPYELGFMGKGWDSTGVAYRVETWAEALRILKPGGHLLAFGGTRTYHRLACAVEDAGFEIRDRIEAYTGELIVCPDGSLAWYYGSGFPKSLDVSKAIDKAAGAEGELLATDHRMNEPTGVDNAGRGAEVRSEVVREIRAPATPEAAEWQGWGTALKPAHEPIVVARKPLAGTVAANLLEHGTGALNIDGCRIESEVDPRQTPPVARASTENWRIKPGLGTTRPEGRWPANLILSEQTAEELDRQSGNLSSGLIRAGTQREGLGYHGALGDTVANDSYGDTGGASRFFYCAKASRAERNAGLDGFDPTTTDDGREIGIVNPYLRGETLRENSHPTVKPIELIRWLVRLVTPPGGTVLDNFLGSGTTGCAAVLEGFNFIGIEREDEYAAIAAARIAWWANVPDGVDTADARKIDKRERQDREAGQASLLDQEAA